VNTQDKVAVERCRSNSVGSQYHDPSVIECRLVSHKEADQLIASASVNGYYWRIQPEDRTGN